MLAIPTQDNQSGIDSMTPAPVWRYLPSLLHGSMELPKGRTRNAL